jgi:hypothetical protein
MKRYYHGTTKDRLESIRAHGLLPGKSLKPLGMPQVFEQASGKDHVYLIEDLKGAQDWARWGRGDIVVLAVRTNKVILPDPNVDMAQIEETDLVRNPRWNRPVRVKGKIRAEQISVVVGEKLIPLAEYNEE